MLLVKTEVRPSRIQGLGLFAAENIPAGTVLCRWDDRFAWTCTSVDLDALPTLARAHVERYGWRDATGRWRLSVDDSRFWNHSRTPNTGANRDGAFTSVALRDIATGEELTEDYSAFDPDFAEYAHLLHDTDHPKESE